MNRDGWSPRQYRRHHKFRIRNKVKKIIKETWQIGNSFSEDRYDEWIELLVRKMEKSRPLCSNPLCCGNPRRMIGRKVLTRREKTAILNEQEELEEFFIENE